MVGVFCVAVSVGTAKALVRNFRWEPRIVTPIAVILTNHAIRSQIPTTSSK